MKYKKTPKDHPFIGDDVLIFDIECCSTVPINHPDYIRYAALKWFGAYSFKDNMYYFYDNNEQEAIQELIDNHKVIVGFNSRDFDLPICTNNKLKFDYKIQIDLLRVLFFPDIRKSNREVIIKVGDKILKDILPNHKLRTIAETLKFSVLKGDINYNIFKSPHWTKQEVQEILKYLHHDIKVTKDLFEFLYKEFLPMKSFMSLEDQRKYNWYRTSIGSYTYKVICHHAGLEEEYNNEKRQYKKYEGGFVSEPVSEKYTGQIYSLDLASAYPHSMMMGNLYSHDCKCCTEEEKWKGNKMFPVQGKYCIKEMGKIETVVKNFYLQRLEYKKNKDAREYAIKIILNTLYGISGSNIFKNMYSINTASDCTLIVRQMIKFAREKFIDNGYELIYTDTDSVYLKDIFNDKDKLLNVKNEIIKEIKENLPFPQDTFNMGIDAEIKVIWFFLDEFGKLKKKNYIYITTDNKLKIKGLPLIKSDCSRLSKKIMEILKDKIINNGDIKFSQEYIKSLVSDLLKEDITLAANYYKIKSKDQYKNKTNIHYQISEVYGAGNHWLVSNKVIGRIGKQKKYCSLEEAKNLSIEELDLKKVFDTELCVFMEGYKHTGLIKRMERSEELEQREEDKKLKEFLDSDLFDKHSVGWDISSEEYYEREKKELEYD